MTFLVKVLTLTHEKFWHLLTLRITNKTHFDNFTTIQESQKVQWLNSKLLLKSYSLRTYKIPQSIFHLWCSLKYIFIFLYVQYARDEVIYVRVHIYEYSAVPTSGKREKREKHYCILNIAPGYNIQQKPCLPVVHLHLYTYLRTV